MTNEINPALLTQEEKDTLARSNAASLLGLKSAEVRKDKAGGEKGFSKMMSDIRKGKKVIRPHRNNGVK